MRPARYETTTATQARRWILASVVAAATTLALAACGGSSGTKSAAKPAAKASGGQAAKPGSTAAATTARPATTVNVVESEFALKLSLTRFSPGRYIFMARNVGRAPHALEIDGPGVKDRKTKTLSGGGSAGLAVTLQKGKYELYCPVDGHRAKGMQLEITVA
jgi:uncharacterized cupredoxin-like copper-binding protein